MTFCISPDKVENHKIGTLQSLHNKFSNTLNNLRVASPHTTLKNT